MQFTIFARRMVRIQMRVRKQFALSCQVKPIDSADRLLKVKQP